MILSAGTKVGKKLLAPCFAKPQSIIRKSSWRSMKKPWNCLTEDEKGKIRNQPLKYLCLRHKIGDVHWGTLHVLIRLVCIHVLPCVLVLYRGSSVMDPLRCFEFLSWPSTPSTWSALSWYFSKVSPPPCFCTIFPASGAPIPWWCSRCRSRGQPCCWKTWSVTMNRHGDDGCFQCAYCDCRRLGFSNLSDTSPGVPLRSRQCPLTPDELPRSPRSPRSCVLSSAIWLHSPEVVDKLFRRSQDQNRGALLCPCFPHNLLDIDRIHGYNTWIYMVESSVTLPYHSRLESCSPHCVWKNSYLTQPLTLSNIHVPGRFYYDGLVWPDRLLVPWRGAPGSSAPRFHFYWQIDTLVIFSLYL